MERVADIKRRAQQFVKNGQWNEAIRAYEALAAAGDPDPYTDVLIGDVHIRRGDLPAAMEVYERALRGYREISLLKNAIALAKKLLRLNHRKSAVLAWLGEFNMLEGLAGEAAFYYTQAADEELLAGNREAAEAHLQNAVGVAPLQQDCSERLVSILKDLGNSPGAASELMRLAQALQLAGRMEEAQERIGVALQLDPSAEAPMATPPVPAQGDAHSMQSLHATLVRDADAVLDGLESTVFSRRVMPVPSPAPTPEPAIPVPPPARVSAASISNVSVRDEAPSLPTVDLSDILREFKANLEEQIAPDDGRAHYDMAMAYFEMNLLGDAITELASASHDVELRPKCCEMLGQCYLRQDKMEDAERILMRGLDCENLTPEGTASLRYHLAVSLQEQGRLQEAREQLGLVVSYRADFLDASARMGELGERRAS